MARANRYVSYLAAEIEPKALSTLSQFEKLTEDTFARIERYSAKQGASIGFTGFDSSARSKIQQTTTALSQAGTQVQRYGSAASKATAESNLLAASFTRSAEALNIVQGPLGGLAGRLGSLGGVFRSLAGFSLATVLGGAGAFSLATVATGYQNVTDRLRPFYDSQVKLNSALADVKRIANDTRQPLDAIAELYSRINQYGKEAGLRSDQTGQVTELAAKAARLSGGTADVQQRGLTQFNQALGRGVLNGQDLRALLEDIPQLGKAIADGLNVPIGKLKELGEQGKLTSRVMVQALLNSADTINTQFERLPVRVGQALTVATNNISAYIGRVDDATGSTQGLADTILVVGNNIDKLVIAGGTLLAALNAKTVIDQFRTVDKLVDGVVVKQTGAFARIGNAAKAAFGPGFAAFSGAGETTSAASLAAANAKGQHDAALAQRAEQEATRSQLRTQLQLIEQQKTAAAAARRDLEAAETSEAAKASAVRLGILNEELSKRVATEEAAAAKLATLQRAQPLVESQLTTTGPGAAASAAAVVENLEAIRVADIELSAAQTLTDGTTRKLSAALQEHAGIVAADAEATSAAIAEQDSIIATSNATRIRTEQVLDGVNKELAASNVLVGETAAGVAVASAEEAAAMEASTLAVRAKSAAMATATAVGKGFQAGASALLGLLGGPWGVAFTAATAAVIYMTTRVDAAHEALDNFGGSQDEVRKQLGLTADSFQKLGFEAQQAAKRVADAAKTNAYSTLQDKTSKFQDALYRASVTAGAQGDKQSQATIQALLDQVRGGNLNNQAAAQRALNQVGQILDQHPEYGLGTNIIDRGINKFKGTQLKSEDLPAEIANAEKLTEALGQATKARNDLDAALGVRSGTGGARGPKKTPGASLLDGDGRTAEEIKADAIAMVESGKAVVDARRQYNAAIKQADAQFKTDQSSEDPKVRAAAEDTYSQAIQNAQRALDRVTNAEAARRQGLVASKRALHEYVQEQNRMDAANDKVTSLLNSVSPEEGAAKRATRQRQQASDIFNTGKLDSKGAPIQYSQLLDKTTGQLVTLKQVQDAITANANKAYTDLIRNQAASIAYDQLRVQGMGNTADLLHQIVDMEETLGRKLQPAEIQNLQNQQVEQQKLNDQIAERNRMIDIYATAVGATQNAVENLLSSPINLKSLKTFKDSLQQAYRQAIAKKISVSIFGDAEQKFRDEMTRGLNQSADQLQTAADKLSSAADALKSATGGGAAGGGTSSAINALGGASYDSSGDLIFQDKGIPQMDSGDWKAFLGDLSSSLPSFNSDGTVTEQKQSGDLSVSNAREIVVTATKAISQVNAATPQTQQPFGSISSLFNKQGQTLGVGVAKQLEKVFGTKVGTTGAPTGLEKALGGIGKGLGTALQGAGVGATVAGLDKTLGISSALGLKSSTTGAEIGGAIGNFIPIPGGSIIGSIIGSVVGGLFKKTPKSSATITSISGDASVTGSSASRRKTASAEADSVQSGLQNILDALGGTEGAFSVSIGTRKKKYVVDPSGQGRTKGSGVLKFDDQADAIQAAILDAINDGAVKGIKQGAANLLKAGNDLDTQLAKAVKFQDVFTELKQYTDPVGAAIDALNTQFEDLISIFNQAGASASDFASLQQLYDYKRQDAIKQATDNLVGQLNDFINGLTAGNDSPLNKKTVYDNAKAQVDALRSDINAGKSVDQATLISALQNYQNASRNVNGSSSAFFQDFNDILSLAEKAKANALAGSTADGTVAGSPFDTADLQKAIAGGASTTTDAINAQTQTLAGLLQTLVNQTGGGSGSGSTSAINLLAGFRNSA